MKKVKPIYKSDCCNTTFETKSNGLYSYYVCHNCHDKTTPKKLDMRKKENKILVGKGSGKMLSRALNNSTPSKSISAKLNPNVPLKESKRKLVNKSMSLKKAKKKLNLVLPPQKIGNKMVKGMTKDELNERIVANSKKKPRVTRKVVDEFPDLSLEPYKIDGDDEFKINKKASNLVFKSSAWWEYMKAKKLKSGEFQIKVLGETITILPNITILRIGNDSKQISGNNKFLLLEKKVQEFMVTLTKELPNNMDKGENRYFLADKKAFEFAIAKYPKVPKMFWFFAFITLLTDAPSELNSKRVNRILNKFFTSKTK